MAEIEYKGIKVGGSKLLIVIPLIGTIMGGLWGGFELFNRYQQMEAKIDKYVAPDLSGFDKRIALIEGKLVEIQESVITARDYTRDIKIDLKKDLDYVTDLTEDSNKETKLLDRELRADINASVKDIKAQMKTVQTEIEESLEKTEENINILQSKSFYRNVKRGKTNANSCAANKTVTAARSTAYVRSERSQQSKQVATGSVRANGIRKKIFRLPAAKSPFLWKR